MFLDGIRKLLEAIFSRKSKKQRKFLQSDPGFFERKEITNPKLENVEVVEREFNKNKWLIYFVSIWREYSRKLHNQYSSESKWLIRKRQKEIPLETEAQDYFRNKGYHVSKTLLESENYVANIFLLAKQETLEKRELEELKIKKEKILKLIRNIIPDEKVSSFAKLTCGLPDLILLNEKEGEYDFCEIKSEKDELSPHQKAWFLQNLPPFESGDSQYFLLKVRNKGSKKKLKPKDSTKHCEYSFYLQGLKYEKLSSKYKSENLKEGLELKLKMEPKNRSDKKAIKVLNSKDNKKIGYIQREEEDKDPTRTKKTKKDKIWEFLKENKAYSCWVVSVNCEDEGSKNQKQSTLKSFEFDNSPKKYLKKKGKKYKIICCFQPL